MPAKVEIFCPNCNTETLLRREPVYEGLKKTGEKCFCSNCSHPFHNADEIPFREKSGPKIFDESEAPKTPKIFDENENAKLCRYCAKYVVNPFIQRCSRHKREVEATDTCKNFEPKPEEIPAEQESPENDKTAKLKKLLGEA